MKPSNILPALALAVTLQVISVQTCQAQIPQQINYQGRVTVQGTNLTGPGKFKFALLGSPVNTNATATAIPVIGGAGDGMGPRVLSITLTFAGSGYVDPPPVTITGGAATGATAHAVLNGTGGVEAIIVDNDGVGQGYGTGTTVTLGAPPENLVPFTAWSNDGTSNFGSEPAEAVTLDVTNGLYSVSLGDTTVPHMPSSIVPGVANGGSLKLRVWFDDGTHGFQLLSPDQPLASVPWALKAANADTAATVPDGSITASQLADGAITNAKLANGAVGTAQLASGAVAANLNASGQSGVPSGGIVLSATENGALSAAGYQQLGVMRSAEYWRRRTDSPGARFGATAVWTGSEMIVWGGRIYDPNTTNFTATNTGYRYNPATDTWTPTNTANAAPRYEHTAVWTGTEMIVWSGNDGGRYNPITDTWTTILSTLPNTPTVRQGHTAVWTGTEMIIWGGLENADGGRFNPNANGGQGAWTHIPENLAIFPRDTQRHNAVWTGTEMIIWGGDGPGRNGGRYNPSANGGAGAWTAIPDSLPNTPTARKYHSMVWTGTEVIVWGGGSLGALLSGGRYNPASNTWAPIKITGAPPASRVHSAVWTGTEMIVWGGLYSNSLATGGAYNPAADGGNGSWLPLPISPTDRYGHTAVWTGREMIIGPGLSDPQSGGLSNVLETWSFTPGKTTYLYQRP